ncbi:aminoacyl-tRNA hydrolase [Nitrolancea hollandica]|uniref:Peptidyl-tRNA hydrolase n=1 Tax=Nitrolancea hollandica Lb TaxID=1129897 RepID=I4EI90_9BACT|nr:aminoacyl-tRNA hydrolase [Nitrolancea hollandica]CCF84402.1 Peptidyl-tRNA hydrolase [Nitrolancea hollandica Lb]
MTERLTWLIAGLGNPGRQYAATRHNIGYMVADELARQLPPGERRHRFDGKIIETSEPQGRIVLLKPETFMNLSGNAVAAAARWYRVPPERLLVIHDDLDLPFGQLRLRARGSSGGHNGLASVIARMGTGEIPRLRIGIGRPEHGNTIPYVLSRFSSEEERALPDVIKLAAEAARSWYRDGIDAAMNAFNRADALPGRDDSRNRGQH